MGVSGNGFAELAAFQNRLGELKSAPERIAAMAAPQLMAIANGVTVVASGPSLVASAPHGPPLPLPSEERGIPTSWQEVLNACAQKVMAEANATPEGAA